MWLIKHVHLQNITKLLISNKFLGKFSPYTKCHTMVFLLIATKNVFWQIWNKQAVVNFPQTTSSIYCFCRILLILQKFTFAHLFQKRRQTARTKCKIFLSINIVTFSQFVTVEHNRRKKIWVSLSVLSYLCSVW